MSNQMELNKKELGLLANIINSVNSCASTSSPIDNYEETINDQLNPKEIDILHDKLIQLLRGK